MAKQVAKQKLQAKKPEPELKEVPSVYFSFLSSFKAQALFLVMLGFIFYANSLDNKYALDDDIIILKNEYVQEGFKGIGKIFSRDAYDSFTRQFNAGGQLSGGRYRPLSIASFAVESQFFGNNAFVRHLVNVVFYLLSLVALLYLLRKYFFRNFPDVAFITALLFTIHPIHTEVVANLKSRDEIFSFLFIILTFIYVFRWRVDKKTSTLLKSLAYFFLALLSKEWGIMLVILLPLSFIIFRKENFSKAIRASLPVFIVGVFYLMLRTSLVGMGSHEGDKELLNNPFLMATSTEKIATKIFILLKYFSLLLIPYPLSCDYSYNTIHYRDFGDWDVWLSILLYAGMFFSLAKFYKSRHPLAFALMFYLSFLSLVSNFVFNVGASMGERLVFHSSLGLVMLLTFGIIFVLEKFFKQNLRKIFLYSLLTIVIFSCGFITIERNAQWKNDITLFVHDAKVVPESTLANGNAGKDFLQVAESISSIENYLADVGMEKLLTGNPSRDSLLRILAVDSALVYLNRTIKIHPKHYIAMVNMGGAYFYRMNFDSVEYWWNKADSIFPRANHPGFWKKYDDALVNVFQNMGRNAGRNNDLPRAIYYLEKAVRYGSQNSSVWTDLGGANFANKNFQRAYECWQTAVQLDPNNEDAKRGLGAIRMTQAKQ